ncbi:MAG TPA: hypothetical protein VNQ73_17860 [Ilumatobacter sp.]|nr:hypothetical protein [Ilumatobacter sp.]
MTCRGAGRARNRAAAVVLTTLIAGTVAVSSGLAHAEPISGGDPVSVIGLPAGSTSVALAQAAYDSTRDRFLVVAVSTNPSSTPFGVVTGLVDAAGVAVPGTERHFLIGRYGFNPDGYPSVAFNPATDEYLVVWTQGSGGLADPGAHSGIMRAVRVSAATGNVVAGPFTVLDPPGHYFCEVRATEIEFNPTNGGYVVSYNYAFFTTSGNAAQVAAGCPGVTADARHQLRVSRLDGSGALLSGTATVPGTQGQSRVTSSIARHPATGEFLIVANAPAAQRTERTLAHRVGPGGALVGASIAIDDNTAGGGQAAADPLTGNWLVASYTSDHGRTLLAHLFTADGRRIGSEVATGGAWNATGLIALGDGTFLLRDGSATVQLVHLGPTGAPIGKPLISVGGDTIVAGGPGAAILAVGRFTLTGNPIGARPILIGAGRPVNGGGPVAPGGRLCFTVAGVPGDVALVNLTPVGADGAGHGQLVSSDVAEPPTASNVNYLPGSTDPNVAAAPIGTDGRVCYVNGGTATVHLVADHLLSIRAAAITLATPTGAARRVADTRIGLGGGRLAPSARLCVTVAGKPGDLALVNLTPVGADAPGNGQLVSSDVAQPPRASNVNFGPGTTDPNVAAAPIGTDGRVCFVNSQHVGVDLVADHLGTVDAAMVTLAAAGGAPRRVADTREGLGGAAPGPSARTCVAVTGPAGGAALVNLTPVGAAQPGNGQLVSSDVTEPPTASNVNYGPGTVDPNVAAAPIGADGKVCYVNSRHTTVHLIADHLATLSPDAITLATPTGAPDRRVDTR